MNPKIKTLLLISLMANLGLSISTYIETKGRAEDIVMLQIEAARCEVRHEEYLLYNSRTALMGMGTPILGSFHGASALENCEDRALSSGTTFYCVSGKK